jgi:hypothetical protein
MDLFSPRYLEMCGHIVLELMRLAIVQRNQRANDFPPANSTIGSTSSYNVAFYLRRCVRIHALFASLSTKLMATLTKRHSNSTQT